MQASRIAAAASALSLALSLGTAGVSHAAPPNDTCGNAQVITVNSLNTPQTITGTNVNATSDLAASGCSLGDDLDVWYALTATIAGNYTFDTLDGLLDDTSLAIYSACGGTRLACNDDIDVGAGIFWSRITIPLIVGQSIRVRVAGYDDASGPFNLNVVATVSPANDACAAAETILLNQTKAGNTLGADTSLILDDASCGANIGAGGGKDVFYSFTPPATGPYTLSLCGSSFDTVLAVLSDCSGSTASILACNDDAAACATSGTNSILAGVVLNSGTPYLVRVAGYDDGTGGASGDFTLVIRSDTPATGVCCRGATCSTTVGQAACMASGTAGASFAAASSSCNSGGSTITPCCYADYNKANSITVQDIFDYLNDWFAGSTFAIVGGDGSGGTLAVQAIFDYLNAWFAGGC